MRKYFSWLESVKWFLMELLKVASGQPSFFSKKRLESGIAFFVVIWGCIFWLLKKYVIMTTSDFVLWATIPLSIAGYIIYNIEKAKLKNNDDTTKENTEH
jgi:hypothetical protein